MRALFNFAERGDLRELVGQAVEYPSVQGIVVDYDPVWMDLWRIKSLHGDRALDSAIRRIFDWHYDPRLFSSRAWESLWIDEGAEIEPPDSSWIPPAWSDIQEMAGRDKVSEEPFVVKICLLPGNSNQVTPEIRDYRLPVITERRTPAILTMPLRQHRPVLGGISIGIGASDSGTLGGIVRDQYNAKWGVTCAHVLQGSVGVDQPAQCDNSTAKPVGTGQHRTTLKSSSGSAPCNPYNALASLNTVDAALVEFSSGINANLQVLNHGALAGITAKQAPSPGLLVDMAGKKSGSRILEIGGLALTYRLRDANGNFFCFKELFELRGPRWWRVTGGRPVQRGDSGAWLLSSPANGTEWVGMALAGDRLVGYAMFAENVAEWAQNTYGLDIRVS